MTKSFDQITKRAVRRMEDKANGDWSYILRIHEKARNLRAQRSAKAFLDTLRRPLPSTVNREALSAPDVVSAVRLSEVA